MKPSDYIRAVVWDFVLCLVLSASLGFINAGGFYVDPSYQNNYLLIIGICAVLLVIFFFAAYSKRTIIIGAIIAAVALLLGIFIAHLFNADESVAFFDDTEANPVVFYIVLFACTLLAFIGTRRRWSCWIFYLVCALDVAYIQFMYEQFYVVAVLILIAAAVVMVVFRNYRNNIATTSTTQISFTGAFGVGAVFTAVVVGLACAIFFGIIAPMEPGALEFKPFTRYLNFETIEMTGIGDDQSVEDPDNLTNETNEEEEETNEDSDVEDIESQASPTEGLMRALFRAVLVAVSDLAALIQEMFNFVIETPLTWPFFIILILAILSSPYFIKKYRRRRWYNRTIALLPREQIKTFYFFFLKRFRILKVKKEDTLTLREFKESTASVLAPFAVNELHATFGDLTDSYARVVYSEETPSDRELARFRSFYESFYAIFRRVGGKVKYILFLRFFRI
ncbi:MAG: hypothetical protein LUD72_03600 [Bacteroidales bacterium]|nr:hypothetical protein [Bacteroidales bacterium]